MDETPKRFNPRIILLVLAVVVLAEIIFAAKTLTEPLPKVTFSNGKITLGKPNIALLLGKNEFKVGENLAINIRVDTNDHKTSGTDVFLRYDPKLLEASGSGAIVKGTIYQDYPAMNVDAKIGLITISGISNGAENGFTGKGILATVNFKTKSQGATKVTLDYNPGSEMDSNILDAASGGDILRKVIPVSLTIK